MSFQKRLDELKQEPSPDPSAWTDAQPASPPEAPPFKAAKSKIQRKNMPTLACLHMPPKCKASLSVGKRSSKCKASLSPWISSKRKKVAMNSEKLFKELDKTKEKMPLPKRTILPKVLEEQKKKVMPKIILLQPNIHVYA